MEKRKRIWGEKKACEKKTLRLQIPFYKGKWSNAKKNVLGFAIRPSLYTSAKYFFVVVVQVKWSIQWKFKI